MAFPALPLDSRGIPYSSVYVPNSGFIALQGVLIASDDSGDYGAVVLARTTSTLFVQTSALQTADGNSGDLAVNPFAEVAVDINLTANQGTTPTIIFILERKGADGIYYPIWQSSVLSATGMVSTSIGAGCATNQVLGSTIRLRWVIGGTSTPGWTFSASIIGK